MAGASAGEWSGTAFGIDLRGTRFPAPGIDVARAGGRAAGPTTVALAPAGAIGELFAAPGSQTLYGRELAGTRYEIGLHPEHGFLLHNDYYGRFRVDAAGTVVDCAPSALPAWLWQRFLVGQLLPLASTLRGLEPMHASAVVVGGEAILLLGSSGAGKTSLALHLAGLGAEMLADDVTAVESADGCVLAHPATSLASVASEELERIPVEARRRWMGLGVAEDETRLVIDRVADRPYPVGAVLLVTRRADAPEISIAPSSVDWPAALLGATFNAYHREPARLERQLEVCARLAATALRRLDVPLGAQAGVVAAAIRRWCERERGACPSAR